jgi:penicillin-binding protein 1A
LSVGTLAAAGTLMYLYNEVRQASERLGTLDQIITKIQTEPSRIVTADGQIIYSVSEEYRKPVRLQEVPQIVRKAILAAEDKRFYDHPGVDLWALGRTLRENVRERRSAQGGSTLTMQLAKRLFTNSRKTLQRKVDDIAIALALEQRLTKDQILELYLNQVYFGEGATGIKAAAEVYFNKPLDKLTISDAALLARLVRRPSQENPFKNLKRAMENRDVVLRIMFDEGMITQSEYQQALGETPKIAAKKPASTARRRGAPYFVDYVLEQIQRDPALADVDLEEGGYVVETTLDLGLQKIAEEAVRTVVNQNARRGIGTGAFLLMDAEGKILVMVGGKDFNRSQVNILTKGYRQPGSSFKPFVYASALRAGAVKENEYLSTGPYKYKDPVTGEEWEPKNSVRFSAPTASLRTALAYSINTTAARVIERVGPNQVVVDAKASFGFTSDRIRPYPSLALGACEVLPIEMAAAYSVFMLGGDRATPYGIKRVIAPDGSVVKSYSPNIVRNVFDRNVCQIIDGMLREVVTSGTGRRALVVPGARGKTGTTNDGRDAWFVGYANGMVGIGWVGNEIPKPTREVYGGQVTVNIWTTVMNAAYKKYGESKAPEVFVGTEPKPRPAEETPPVDMQPAAVPEAEAPTGENSGEIPVLTDEPAAEEPEGIRTAEPPPNPPQEAPRYVPPPQPTPPVRTELPEPRPTPRAEVSVEVCADTGMRASIYCPETVTRSFPRGSEPRKRCTLHGGHR